MKFLPHALLASIGALLVLSAVGVLTAAGLFKGLLGVLGGFLIYTVVAVAVSSKKKPVLPESILNPVVPPAGVDLFVANNERTARLLAESEKQMAEVRALTEEARSSLKTFTENSQRLLARFEKEAEARRAAAEGRGEGGPTN